MKVFKAFSVFLLLFIAFSCEQENIQSENSIESLLTGNDVTLLKELAEQQIQFESILSKIGAEANIDWENLEVEISSISDEEAFDKFIQKYNLSNYPTFKSTALSYLAAVSKINENYNLKSITDNQKRLLIKKYIEYFPSSSEIIFDYSNPNEVVFRRACSDDCYWTGIENGLLCAAGCIGGPIGCWIAVACEIVNYNQTQRCYAACNNPQ